MSSWFVHPVPLLAAAAAIPTAAGLTVWWVLSHRKSTEEMERERRDYLVRQGRIIDGTILDWAEAHAVSGPGTLIYRYDIAGVTYECAQDLTWLEDAVKVDTSCLGMPVSVRYDSKNPGNSIVVAETWSGLRQPGEETAAWAKMMLAMPAPDANTRQSFVRETSTPEVPKQTMPGKETHGSMAR